MPSLLRKLFPQNPAKEMSFFPRSIPQNTTPYFAIDNNIVNNRIDLVQKYLSCQKYSSKLAYSFKTNYDLAASNTLHHRHLLAETVSQHEYQIAQRLGFKPTDIILNGPNKQDFIKPLLLGSLIHLDNFSEITHLIDQNLSPSAKINLGIRVNVSDIPSRFGFNIDNGDAANALASLVQSGHTISSLHIHLGSDIYNPRIYQIAAKSLTNFINQHALILKTIDFGGGFPAHGQTPYGQKTKNAPEISEYLKAISVVFEQINCHPTLILEPGRYLVDDACVFVSRVINIAYSPGFQTATLDSTINMLPSLWYRPATIAAFNKNYQPLESTQISTTIFGSSCQEHDKLFQGKLPTLNLGDLIVFYAVGAYNQSQSGNFIFPQPKTYFI